MSGRSETHREGLSEMHRQSTLRRASGGALASLQRFERCGERRPTGRLSSGDVYISPPWSHASNFSLLDILRENLR